MDAAKLGRYAGCVFSWFNKAPLKLIPYLPLKINRKIAELDTHQYWILRLYGHVARKCTPEEKSRVVGIYFVNYTRLREEYTEEEAKERAMEKTKIYLREEFNNVVN